MPTWNDILSEITRSGSTHDVVRRDYLKKAQRHHLLLGLASKSLFVPRQRMGLHAE
jgi:hypothetical protein